MPRTKQQQATITAVLDPANSLIKVKAVAGAGKTYTLIELAKELNPASGMYLAYNKAISDEAAEKFKGTNIKCSTVHSLAYNGVVRQYNLKVGYFGVRDLYHTGLESYDRKLVVDTLEDFFLSDSTDVDEYLEAQGLTPQVLNVCMTTLNLMSSGKMQCTHSFYLKFYHIQMAIGAIPTPSTDLLLVDEAGDLTMLTLAIFKLIKAPTKVAVGDPMQNIYGFNNTINAFEILKDEGVNAELTESFRVSDVIANRIQRFVRATMDPEFNFTGRFYTEPPERMTKAYISRSNSGLLKEMLRLMDDNIPFHTTRRIATMLELPIVLANLDNGKSITEYKYKYIETLRRKYEDVPSLAVKYGTIEAYISYHTRDDDELKHAFKVVGDCGIDGINKLVAHVTACKGLPCDLTLTTAHSSKGLEFAIVEIAPDLNYSVEKAIADLEDIVNPNSFQSKAIIKTATEELRLGYVAASRSMVELINADFLPKTLIS